MPASLGTVEGLIDIRSSFGPKETMDRVEAEIRAAGLDLFAHIDHAAAAAEVGLPLAPTDLIIFGNARSGTPFMQSVQTVGIDLPLKILVWQDAANTTWLSYNEPRWIAERHDVTNAGPVVNKMTALLNAIAKKAASPERQETQSPRQRRSGV